MGLHYRIARCPDPRLNCNLYPSAPLARTHTHLGIQYAPLQAVLAIHGGGGAAGAGAAATLALAAPLPFALALLLLQPQPRPLHARQGRTVEDRGGPRRRARVVRRVRVELLELLLELVVLLLLLLVERLERGTVVGGGRAGRGRGR